MTRHEASRTLLKSAPELWAECSDATSLRRHLDRFGEIRITRLEPETAVAWEGENVSGTVKLEPSGWGTRVILTAEEAEMPRLPPRVVAKPAPPVAEPEPVVEPVAEPEPVVEPVAEPESEPPLLEIEIRRGLFARIASRFRRLDDVLFEPRPAPAPPPTPAPPHAAAPPVAEQRPPEPRAVRHRVAQPVAAEPARAATADLLSGALESLGMAHHRPFSRS